MNWFKKLIFGPAETPPPQPMEQATAGPSTILHCSHCGTEANSPPFREGFDCPVQCGGKVSSAQAVVAHKPSTLMGQSLPDTIKAPQPVEEPATLDPSASDKLILLTQQLRKIAPADAVILTAEEAAKVQMGTTPHDTKVQIAPLETSEHLTPTARALQPLKGPAPDELIKRSEEEKEQERVQIRKARQEKINAMRAQIKHDRDLLRKGIEWAAQNPYHAQNEDNVKAKLQELVPIPRIVRTLEINGDFFKFREAPGDGGIVVKRGDKWVPIEEANIPMTMALFRELADLEENASELLPGWEEL